MMHGKNTFSGGPKQNIETEKEFCSRPLPEHALFGISQEDWDEMMKRLEVFR